MDAFVDTLIQLLADWGYAGLFISALLAGSVVPFSSELVMIAPVKVGLSPAICVLAATLGDTAGGMTCYYVGRLGKTDWIEKYFKIKKKKVDKMRHFLQGKGALMALFTFLPFVGEAIAIALGSTRSNATLTVFSVFMGKLIRYIVTLLALQGALSMTNGQQFVAPNDLHVCMKRIIERTEDGSMTLFVSKLNEHYHSIRGARTESQYILISMGFKASTAFQPCILKIGFGTGLNALLTLETAGEEKRVVHYTDVELYPLSWEEVDVLNYSDNPLFKKLHASLWNKDVNITSYFTLHKIQGDVSQVFCGRPSTTDGKSSAKSPALFTDHLFGLVHFDAFAPEKQPEMWSEELFRNIYAGMNTDGILTTYCAEGVIRHPLQAVGFTVERLPGPPGGKREILRTSKKVEGKILG